MAITVLMDTSASMTTESIQRGEAIVRDLVRRNSGADLRLITFADRSRVDDLPAQAGDVTIPQRLTRISAWARILRRGYKQRSILFLKMGFDEYC